MAGAGKKTFTAGDVLTASEVNTYLMEQSVMVFADEAARTAAIPSPSEGMVTYINSGDRAEGLYTFTGGLWVSARSAVPGFSATNSAAQTITANTLTVVTLGTETYDHGGVFASNTFTVPSGYAGKWLLVGQVSWLANSTGDNKVTYITRQASGGGAPTLSNVIAAQAFMGVSTFIRVRANLSTIFNATAGDLFKLCVTHDGSGTQQVLANDPANGNPVSFQAIWLGS
jgi:hypothetical protein